MATLVTNVGYAITSGIMLVTPPGGSSPGHAPPQYIGWGTGAGTTAVTDTTLFTEDSGGSPTYARATGTTSQITTSVTNDTWQGVGTLTANASKTITNGGVFDATTGGNLFVKGDFTGIALNTSDAIQFTFQVQVS